MKTQIQQILANQNEIIQQLNTVKKDVKEIKGEMEKRKLETNEPIQVPNRIKSAVKDGIFKWCTEQQPQLELQQKLPNIYFVCLKEFLNSYNIHG